MGGHPSDHRLHPHRRRARVRRDPHAVPRRPPHPARRRDRPLRADRQDPAHLHILRLADDPGYRRQTKSQANLQEGRHSLARKIFHGRSGQLYQRYQDGMEDQIGALGLVLNALVLFNTRYMNAAVNQLRAPDAPEDE
nr:transposase [Streptomyces monomycini]